jgi:hypothetical protein
MFQLKWRSMRIHQPGESVYGRNYDKVIFRQFNTHWNTEGLVTRKEYESQDNNVVVDDDRDEVIYKLFDEDQFVLTYNATRSQCNWASRGAWPLS